MDTSRKVLVAEAWCRSVPARPRVHEALRQAAQASSTRVGHGAWQDAGMTKNLAALLDKLQPSVANSGLRTVVSQCTDQPSVLSHSAHIGLHDV